MFQSIALAVIADGANARVEMKTFRSLYVQLNDNKIKETIKQILDMEQGQSISIINNIELSQKLQKLADSMTTCISNANKKSKRAIFQILDKINVRFLFFITINQKTSFTFIIIPITTFSTKFLLVFNERIKHYNLRNIHETKKLAQVNFELLCH